MNIEFRRQGQDYVITHINGRVQNGLKLDKTELSTYKIKWSPDGRGEINEVIPIDAYAKLLLTKSEGSFNFEKDIQNNNIGLSEAFQEQLKPQKEYIHPILNNKIPTYGHMHVVKTNEGDKGSIAVTSDLLNRGTGGPIQSDGIYIGDVFPEDRAYREQLREQYFKQFRQWPEQGPSQPPVSIDDLEKMIRETPIQFQKKEPEILTTLKSMGFVVYEEGYITHLALDLSIHFDAKVDDISKLIPAVIRAAMAKQRFIIKNL